MASDKDLNLDATELRLGLPATNEDTSKSVRNNKRLLSDADRLFNSIANAGEGGKRTSPPSKAAMAQVVGWPPVRSFRRNQQQHKSEAECSPYVKVGMEGAPYLRKIQLKVYDRYPELLKALEEMFPFKAGQYSEKEGYSGSEYVPTYEDKDGDWMLVVDVPWEMFTTSCKRLRIMKESEAKGLGCTV